ELLRPALYQAWHEIVEVGAPRGAAARYDVVGPVCESSDILGTDRSLAIAPGELLAILATGAYGMTMASNYNSRPRPPEILVEGDEAREMRERESIKALFSIERRLGATSCRYIERTATQR